MLDLDPYISKTPGFPKQGITFYDISPALEDPLILKQACAALCDLAAPMQPDLVAGIDARGFLFAVPVATDRDCGGKSDRYGWRKRDWGYMSDRTYRSEST